MLVNGILVILLAICLAIAIIISLMVMLRALGNLFVLHFTLSTEDDSFAGFNRCCLYTIFCINVVSFSISVRVLFAMAASTLF